MGAKRKHKSENSDNGVMVLKAELITIGTELLLGEIVDTNAAFLARELANCGVNLYFKSTVGDNLERAQEVLKRAINNADLIIISGGLGPTEDDITREVVSLATERGLVEESSVLLNLENWYTTRYGDGNSMPIQNRKQALFPKGSNIVPNPVGTAPGFWLEVHGKIVVALPGVSKELQAMFNETIRPLISLNGSTRPLAIRNLNFVGVGESNLADLLSDIIDHQTNPTVALYSSTGKVRVRLGAQADSIQEGFRLIRPLEEEIIKRAINNFYGYDDQSLEEVVAAKLIKNRFTLALAESCTGGLIGHTLTNVPGSSLFFQRGYVVYSNLAKQEDLGVKKETLDDFGAVSSQVAMEMAEGVRKKTNTDFGLAVTGIAGPGGGSEDKPVGLVYISLAHAGDTIVQKYLWKGTREQVKQRSTLAALHLLWDTLKSHSKV